MLQYTIEEAERLAWIRKINEINSNREIKQTLLGLLDQNFDEFLAEKRRLLDNDHGQGIFWTPTLSWLWATISFLLPFVSNWNPMPGSQLRAALEKGIAIHKFELLSLDDTPAASQEELLDDKDYENALFEDPKSALSDIQGQMSALAEELAGSDRLSLSKKIDNVIERLHALKLRLTPETYHQLLSELFQKYPIETLSFYLNCYEAKETPDPHDAIEYHLMSQALMDRFVFQHHPDSISSRLFAVQKLLMLLAFDKGKALKELLTKAKESGLPPQRLYIELNKYYGDRVEGDDPITARWIQGVKGKIEGKLNIGDEPFSMKLLEKMFAEKKTKFSLAHKLLFPHIARLACHDLIDDYHQKEGKGKETEEFKERMQMLEFLGKEILKTWENTKKQMEEMRIERRTVLTQENKTLGTAVWNTLLNTDKLSGSLGSSTGVIKYTHQILAANTFGSALIEARNIAKMLSHPLSKGELAWIFDSLKRVEPEGLKLAREVNHILTSTIFYRSRNLDSLDKVAPQSSIEELITQIAESFKNARNARKKLSKLYKDKDINKGMEKEIIDAENKAINKAVTIFNDLLNNNNQLNSSELEQIFALFKELAPLYLTQELTIGWREKIFAQQKQQCLLDEEELKTSSIETAPSLSLIAQAYEEANAANKEGHFTKEIGHANTAVQSFYLFLQDFKAPVDESIEERMRFSAKLEDALKILNRQLAPSYLTEEMAKQWKQTIYTLQEQVKRFSKKDLLQIDVPSNITKEDLLNALRNSYNKAIKANANGDFKKELTCAPLALRYYDLLLQETVPEEVNQARELFNKLKPYLTEELESEFSSRLAEIKSSVDNSSQRGRNKFFNNGGGESSQEGSEAQYKP